MKYPQYTTYSPEERARLFGIQPETPPTGRSRIRFRTLRCVVTYPDGSEASASYERLAPHQHRYVYRDESGATIARLYVNGPVENTVEAIESLAKERAQQAFEDAMEDERRYYFARASETFDGARKKNPDKYRLKASEAKERGGKYALCIRLGSKLVPVSEPLETFSLAVARWGSRIDPSAVIACCNRLDRCWELLKFNPLVQHGHPKRP